MITLYIILACYLIFWLLIHFVTVPVGERKKTSAPARSGGKKKSVKRNETKETGNGKNTPQGKGNSGQTPKTNKKPPRRKNVSQTVPNGRTLQTRDEFVGVGNKNYRKSGYGNKGYYRKVVVVDSNRNDEVAVVKLTTSPKGTPIESYKSGKSKFKPFVETKDSDGNPIKIGEKFIENPSSADVPQDEVSKIKKQSFENSRNASKNRKVVRKMKGRKKNTEN